MSVDRRDIERYVPQLRRYARGLAGDSASADDLVQETVLKALARERQFRGVSLGGWLFAILTNLARSKFRDERRHVAVEMPDDIADRDRDPGLRVDIANALSGLSGEHREVLLLNVVQGFSYRETAEILDIPIGTVMSRLARARDHFARRLEGAPVVPLRGRR